MRVRRYSLSAVPGHPSFLPSSFEMPFPAGAPPPGFCLLAPLPSFARMLLPTLLPCSPAVALRQGKRASACCQCTPLLQGRQPVVTAAGTIMRKCLLHSWALQCMRSQGHEGHPNWTVKAASDGHPKRTRKQGVQQALASPEPTLHPAAVVAAATLPWWHAAPALSRRPQTARSLCISQSQSHKQRLFAFTCIRRLPLPPCEHGSTGGLSACLRAPGAAAGGGSRQPAGERCCRPHPTPSTTAPPPLPRCCPAAACMPAATRPMPGDALTPPLLSTARCRLWRWTSLLSRRQALRWRAPLPPPPM